MTVHPSDVDPVDRDDRELAMRGADREREDELSGEERKSVHRPERWKAPVVRADFLVRPVPPEPWGKE